MRRLVVLFGLVAVTGCSDFKSLFRAHSDVAAEAGQLELSSERLAEILTGPKGLRINSDAARFVAALWTDYALFAEAVSQNKLPADSAAIAGALWPAIAEIKATRWHDALVSQRASFSDAQLDSMFSGSQFRVFQHILFNVSQTATPEERAAARRQAENALGRAQSGANFSALAAQLSQDPGSARDSGYLPASPRGQWMTSFDSAGWTLKSGELSGVVETPYGFHVIKRPAFSEASQRLRQTAVDLAIAHIDSVYFDSLAKERKLEMRANASEKMREAIDDIEAHRGSNERLATFNGGSFTVGDFLRWVGQLPPAYQMQLAQIPDSQLVDYGMKVAQNELLLQQADSAGVGPTPEEWASLREQYQSQVDTLRTEMELTTDVSDSTIAAGQRQQLAALKVTQYFDRIISGQLRARRLPASLGDVLRERLPHKIYPNGIATGLQLAQRKSASDSASQAAAPGVTGAPGVPQMQPAPGPAPTIAPDSGAQ